MNHLRKLLEAEPLIAEDANFKSASSVVQHALGPAVDNLERYLNSSDPKATKAGLAIVFGALAGVLDSLGQPTAAAVTRAAFKELRTEKA